MNNRIIFLCGESLEILPRLSSKNYFEQCDMIKNLVRYILYIKKKYSDWKNIRDEQPSFSKICFQDNYPSYHQSLHLFLSVSKYRYSLFSLCSSYLTKMISHWTQWEWKKKIHMVTYPPQLASIKRKREKNYECHGTSKRSWGSGVNLKKRTKTKKQRNCNSVLYYITIRLILFAV